MARLDDLTPRTSVRGIIPDCLVTVVGVQWFGSETIELPCREPDFGVTSVNYDFAELLARAVVPV